MSSMVEKGFLWGPEMNQLEVRNTCAVINKTVLKRDTFNFFTTSNNSTNICYSDLFLHGGKGFLVRTRNELEVRNTCAVIKTIDNKSVMKKKKNQFSMKLNIFPQM